MSEKVAGISLKSTGPTNVAMKDLRDWVIWQFPKPRKGGLSGAVRPSTIGHGWYPAIIQHEKNRVQVYGNISQPYDSPELAAKGLDQFLKKASQQS